MQFAPDGRLFVAQQGGQLRVIKNGGLLSTPFVSLTVSSSGERGLLGVAFDPDFLNNQFVYLFYTATTPSIHNRISRFKANGDVADTTAGEVVILDFDNLSSATNHNGPLLSGAWSGKCWQDRAHQSTSGTANKSPSRPLDTKALSFLLRVFVFSWLRKCQISFLPPASPRLLYGVPS